LGIHDDAALVVGAESDRLTVLETDEHGVAILLGGDLGERTIVENVAVLVDLDERRTLVVIGAAEHLHHVIAIHVVGASDEGRLDAERHRQWVERLVERTIGVDLVILPTSLVGEY